MNTNRKNFLSLPGIGMRLGNQRLSPIVPCNVVTVANKFLSCALSFDLLVIVIPFAANRTRLA